jgi:beta-galactosidase/beta-glucuronidase
MKKHLVIVTGLILLTCFVSAQDNGWKIAGNKITTRWAGKVDPLNPLPEYPRPQMVRSEWKSLNGLWEYAVTGSGESMPKTFQGRILVPFAIESALSGVNKPVGPDNILWYRTKFIVPATFKKKNILLHFGAVDWLSEIYVNGTKAGTHQGGYDPFTIDITSMIKGKGPQVLELRVTDPVDKGPQPRGKQVLNPGGIWYTSVTGIWQTV